MWLNENQQVRAIYAWLIFYISTALFFAFDFFVLKKIAPLLQANNFMVFLLIGLIIMKLIYFSLYLLLERIILYKRLPNINPILRSIISFVVIDLAWFVYTYTSKILSGQIGFLDIIINAHINIIALYIYILPTIVYIIFSAYILQNYGTTTNKPNNNILDDI